MALIAQVENGQLIDSTAATAADSSSAREVNNSMDKEAFLQLLVAQMQYQDPLEPTSNTEYVAQLATFSELEAMTNLNESMSISRASDLVGKKVSIQTTSATTGEITETEGTVDYVLIENNKAYLVIDGNPYAVDDLAGIMTEEYWEEYQDMIQEETSVTAQVIMAAIASLPEETKDITLEHAELINAARKSYNDLSSDEKLQVTDEYLIKLIKAENMIAKLEAAQKKEEADKSEDESAENTDSDNTANETETV